MTWKHVRSPPQPHGGSANKRVCQRGPHAGTDTMHVQLKSICSAATGTALFGGQQDNELPCVSWAHLVTPLQVLVGGSTPEADNLSLSAAGVAVTQKCLSKGVLSEEIGHGGQGR